MEKYWVYLENVWDNPGETFDKLKEEIPFEQGKVFVHGKWHEERRLTCYYGDKYTYSGRQIPKNEPPKDSKISEMFTIVNSDSFRTKLQNYPILKEHTIPKFNACLINLYRGADTRNADNLTKGDMIGAHADDENSLKSSIILSLSFGEVRTFRFRKFYAKSGWEWEQKLQPGSMLMMLPGCQQHYKHFVPEEKKVKGDRINLTFRYV